MNAALIADWLDWLQSGSTAPSTLRQRGYTLRAFARDYDLMEATPDDVQEYLGRPIRGPEARKSVLATLRSFYRWAAVRGYIDQDPTRLARSIHVPPGVPKPCPESVLGRALLLPMGSRARLHRPRPDAPRALDPCPSRRAEAVP